jgi:predicted nucleic acid-binding protein
MNIVLDTNIFLAIALDEPEKDWIIQLTLGTNAIAPDVLPYEVGNALSAMIKRHRLTSEQALAAYDIVNHIPVRLMSIDISSALELASRFDIYAYDAYFLQCAWTYPCPLMTLDKRMKQVATELNIKTIGVI